LTAVKSCPNHLQIEGLVRHDLVDQHIGTNLVTSAKGLGCVETLADSGQVRVFGGPGW
jgi:hypothetical protein